MILLKDRFFYIIQAFLIKRELPFFERVRPLIYKLFFKKIGNNVRISPNVHFKFPSEIIFDDNVYVGRNSIFVGKNGLSIGKNVLIGAGTKICTTSHNFSNKSKPINEQGLCASPIEICENVWFGFDCKVLGGVTIGKDTIVATNSVLLENHIYDENSKIAGIPAKKKGSVYD